MTIYNLYGLKINIINIKMKLIYAVSVFLIIAIIAISGYFYLSNLSNNKYAYETVIGGVRINSEIPPEGVQGLKTIALLNSSDNAAITCNFELSAISNPDRRGYIVKIENGKKEVYITQKMAYIRGETDDEILDACHAFVCLRDGIKCPGNFRDIRDTISNSDRINVIFDSRLTGKGVRAYAEILGALGYLQAVLADSDKDGVIEQTEIKNKMWIYPYLREGDNCTLQPFRSIIEILNATNETRDCNIEPGIYIQLSDNNEIEVDDGRIILSGDEEHIYTGAIILRDIISPQWIRVMYGLN